MAEWRTRERLRSHFGLHGRDVGVRTIADYEASSKAVIDRGTLFEYEDLETEEWRLGYYDRDTELLTVVTDDDLWVVSHYRCSERYVRDILTGSTYA